MANTSELQTLLNGLDIVKKYLTIELLEKHPELAESMAQFIQAFLKAKS